MAAQAQPINLHDNDFQYMLRSIREQLLQKLNLEGVNPFEIQLFRLGKPANFNGQFFYITSVRNTMRNTYPGSTCEVEPGIAAIKLAEGTHVLATPEDINRFHAEQRQRERECRIQDIQLRMRDGRATDREIEEVEAHRLGQQSPLEARVKKATKENLN